MSFSKNSQSKNNSKEQEMQDDGAQEKLMGEDKRELVGYMAIYHDVEEICYGPACGLPANARVFMCIRHKLLRDGLCQKLIGKSFIMEKTGLTLGQVKVALRFLEQKEIILVHRSKTGKVWNESKYELNPKKFPALYNWYKNNPTVRVYRGKKDKESYPHVGSDSTPGVGSYSALGVVPDSTPGKTIKLLDLLRKSRSNNPSSNNPKENNPSSENFNFLENGTGKKVQLEDIEAEKARQLAMAKTAGIL